jgi:hypothetical protein
MAKKAVLVSQKLYDDYDIDFDELREVYAEITDDNTILNSRDNDSAFIEWVYGEYLNSEWTDLLDNIKYSKYGNIPCVVVGTLGLWNGRKDIYPTKCDDLVSAINKCAGSASNVIVILNNGYIEVNAMHHDGTNCFEIHLLNKLGIDTMGADLTKPCYYRQISGYLF